MKRDWTIRVEDFEDEAEFAGQVYGSLTELAAILMRLGGVGGIAPHRVEQDDGSFVVERVVFKYDSYAPGYNQRQVREATNGGEPEAEAEPEEVAAA